MRPTDARDPDTVAYFDDVVPEYGVDRLAEVAAFIAEHRGPDSGLIDVGAGTGNTLVFLERQTGIANLAALDVSSNCLRILADRVDCELHHGSILDAELVHSIGPRFDFAVVAAVLHHLIGKSRRQSREFAALAVANAKRLLKPGGYLLIHEPVFSPPIAMSAVFYVKKAITRITSERVDILGYGNNIGAPVVSYYTTKQVQELADSGAPSRTLSFEVETERLPRLLEPLLGRANVTTVLKKESAA